MSPPASSMRVMAMRARLSRKRSTAECIAGALGDMPEVSAVALYGSVARGTDDRTAISIFWCS